MKTQALKCYIYTNLAAQVSHSLNGQLQTSTIWGGKNIPRSSSETQTQMMQCKLSKMHNLILEMTWLSFFFLSYFFGTREVATSEVHFFSFLFLLSTDLGGKSSLSGVLLSSKSKWSGWTALNYNWSRTTNDSGSRAFKKGKGVGGWGERERENLPRWRNNTLKELITIRQILTSFTVHPAIIKSVFWI